MSYISTSNVAILEKKHERLTLVENVLDGYHGIDFSSMVLIAAQHILPTTLTMLLSFIDRGLKPDNIFLLGKCYSTDNQTLEKLRVLGVYVCDSSNEFIYDVEYSTTYKKNVEDFGCRVLPLIKEKNKVICLDDGGYLISFLSDLSEIPNLDLTAIEQTSSGYERIKKQNLTFPVINVARSYAKLNYESEIVVRTVLNAIEKILHPEMVELRCLVIGGGAIGLSAARKINKNFSTDLIDINSSKSWNSYHECMSNLHCYDLVLGCSGSTSLSVDNISKLKPGAILASLSSSDVEFDIIKERSAVTEYLNCHSHFFTRFGSIVLNSGFPINFNGVPSEVDIAEFELTRALLASSICHSFTKELPDQIVPVSTFDEALIVSNFKSKYL